MSECRPVTRNISDTPASLSAPAPSPQPGSDQRPGPGDGGWLPLTSLPGCPAAKKITFIRSKTASSIT